MSQAGVLTTAGGGGGGVVNSVTGTNGVTASTVAGAVTVSGVNATTTTVGVASFNSTEFSVTVGGAVSLIIPSITGSVTTTGFTSAALFTFPLGATPGVYTFDITVAGFAKSGVGSPLGCGFTIVGSVRTTGAAAILIAGQQIDHFEEGLLGSGSPAVTAILGVSGNNAVVTVTGISDGAAGFVIDWTGFFTYTFAS